MYARRVILLAATALAAGLITGGVGYAAPGPAPLDGHVVCVGKRCQVVAESPGLAPVSAPAPAGGRAPRAGSVHRVPTRTLTPQEQQDAAEWARHRDVYCQAAPANAPECQPAPAAAPRRGAAPAPAQPVVTPGMATQRALDQIELALPQIGSAPCTDPGCQGTVNAPVWLWTRQPWQAQTATATAGPFTVTAEAIPTQVQWSLGDGQTFVCTGPGTPFDADRYGWAESPTCGSPGYTKAGRYRITAVMTYEVTWSGADSGSQTMQTQASVPVPVGEYQAVVTR